MYFLLFESLTLRWWCPHHFPLNNKSSCFSFSSQTNHLHKVVSSLIRSGLAALVSSQSIAETLFISFSFDITWYFHNQDHRPECSECLVVLLTRAILIFLMSMCLRVYAVIFDSSSGQMFPSLVVICFFVSMSWTRINPFDGFFVLCSANRVTPIQKLDNYLFPFMSTNHWSSPYELHQNFFYLLLNINMIQMYRKSSHQNIEFRPWSDMIPVHVISHDLSKNLFELRDLDLDLGLFLQLLKRFLEILVWSRFPACKQQNITAVFLAIWRSFYMESGIHVFYLNAHLFSFEPFSWWHCFGIVRIRYQ